jgi:hypothetical protein
MEHYTVHCSHQNAECASKIEAPVLSYYADPFICIFRGEPWVFVEEFRYLQNRGRIIAIPLQTNSQKTYVALDLPYHLSFPCLLEFQGQLFMVPESSRDGGIDLYACVNFPSRWSLVRRLIDKIDAVDSVIFENESSWWLLTSVRRARNSERSLALFFSKELFSGQWISHPINNMGLYSNKTEGYGRNGGSIFRRGSNIYRIMQSSKKYYGQAIEVMQITVLTEKDFSEMPSPTEFFERQLKTEQTPHHLCVRDQYVVWDVRDRVSYREHLPFFEDAY